MGSFSIFMTDTDQRSFDVLPQDEGGMMQT
jgi:hypothetical protein